MIVDGEEITRETAKYKFGGDPMAEYLWALSLDSAQDEDTGDTDFGLWCARFGRRLLCTNSQGFVWVQQYRSEELAKSEFAEIDGRYADWSNDDDDE